MKKMITGVLIDVKHNGYALVPVEHSLKEFYNNLHCDVIDIAVRKVGGRPYVFVCNDEGLLKNRPKVSAVNDMGEPMFVGNLLIVGEDKDGKLIDLVDEDLEYLKQYIHLRSTPFFPDPYPVLHQVEYL